MAHFIRCSFFVAAAPIYRRLDYMLLLLLLLLLLLQLILGRTIVCTAVLPLPGLKLATAPLALANQQLSLLGRACFNQAQPGQRGSILELCADTNPQFGRGSTADRLHTSRLSFSTNCSVTAPCCRGRQSNYNHIRNEAEQITGYCNSAKSQSRGQKRKKSKMALPRTLN